MEKLIKRDLSCKVLMIGEYFKHDAPGGMAAVLASYDVYFEDMKFIPTWKAGGILTKIFYALYGYLAFLWAMIFDKEIRIVHIQGAAFASFERNMFFVYWGKKFHKKVIMHMHCADFASYYDSSKHKNRILSTINACDKFLVLSRQWRDYFEGIGVRKEIVFILNNTITPPRFDNVNVHNADDKIRLLYLGIIGPRKGVYDLIKVIGDNKEYYRQHLMLHIGGNGETDEIESLIEGYDVGDFVIFEGFVKGEKKIKDLNWADIFILPSYNEGLPIAILEAMSYGMPIISTNVGGIPEVVKTDVNGKLIDPGDLRAIKDSIDYYIEHRESVGLHGEASKKLVSPFLPDEVFRTLAKLYMELLS